MIQKIILFLNFILLVFSGFAQNSVSGNLSIPSVIPENEDISVTLFISKPENLHSFASFTQKIPEGFFVKSFELKNAEVIIGKNELKINWMRLPSGKSIKISYELQHIRGIKGRFSLNGKLNWFISGKKGEYNIPAKYFTIKNQDKIEQQNIQNDYSVKVFASGYNISCIRTLKKISENTYNISVKITNIPKGKTFILTEEINDEFEFLQTSGNQFQKINNRIIQFETANTSENKEVLLSYTIKKKAGKNKSNPVIFGKLSFTDKNQIVNIPVRTIQ